jgi:signal transduction histidine kinase
MLTDPMKLRQVFLNLLHNAIEAMPDGGTIGAKSI